APAVPKTRTEDAVAAKNRKTAPPKKNMKPFYVLLAAIAVIGIGAIFYSMRSGAEMATEPLDMSTIANADSLLAQARGIPIGDENAPVQVIVFSDFQCGGCAHWTTNVEPLVKQEYVETGKVRYTYYDYPITSIHAHAFLAARAARCALDQDKFWEYHDRVFAGQYEWSYSRTAPVDIFTRYATETGLDVDEFTQCLRSDRHAETVTANALLGQTLGVNGTPTVYINQRKLGDREWQDFATVSAAIQAAGGV